MLARFLLLASVLLVTACSSTQDESLTSSVPVSEREAITQGTSETGDGFETVDVYSEDMAAKATQQYLEKEIGNRVQFGYDSYTLTSEARKVLLMQAKWLQRFSKLGVTIEGHCDERGTREYNLALGERRANAVKTYLLALGINGSRISVVSYGKERPIEAGSNDAAWAQNRRAVTIID